MPNVFGRLGEMDNGTRRAIRFWGIGRLRKREHVSEDGGVIGEQSFVNAKLNITRDQDHISILEPELLVPFHCAVTRSRLCNCAARFVTGTIESGTLAYRTFRDIVRRLH